MAGEPNRPLDGARVLIVEDEYLLADDLSQSLANAGAEVLGPVATIEDARRMMDGGGFDCAVLDMNLRGDLAFALADRLGASGVPFVVATGYNRSALPDALKDVPRVEKPFAPSEVIELLVEMRRMPRLRA